MGIDALFYFNVACHLNCANYKISIRFVSMAVDGPCTDGHICCRKQYVASKVLNMSPDCPVQLDRSSQGRGGSPTQHKQAHCDLAIIPQMFSEGVNMKQKLHCVCRKKDLLYLQMRKITEYKIQNTKWQLCEKIRWDWVGVDVSPN